MKMRKSFNISRIWKTRENNYDVHTHILFLHSLKKLQNYMCGPHYLKFMGPFLLTIWSLTKR